ncbi:MAG: tetratricopeptide repeat protein [Gammaproteobacteria bacterium]|nr:tetratricopeptide repeat protein [Gammaproteobacteria bacterium]MCW5583755.1 tetratricopeptide repeat protein [Gammaproteobacteria bacterium]
MRKRINQLLLFIIIGLMFCSQAVIIVQAADSNSNDNTKDDNYTLSIKDEQTNKVITIKLIQYNSELYELGYKVFTMNNKITDAYLLALAAVKQRPEDLLWRRRLAQVAIWNSQYETALDQWVYIAKQTKNIDDIEAGKKIAKQIYHYSALSELLWLQISTNYAQKPLWLEYINAVETAGKPELAIAKLQMAVKVNSDPFFKEQLANLYQSLGDIEKEKAVIDKVHLSSPSIAVKRASILINQRHIKEAFDALDVAHGNASLEDKNFWTMYAQLAWSINNHQAALHGYKIVLNQGSADLESYQRIIVLLADRNPTQALSYAKIAMAKYKTNSEIPMYVLGIEQQLGHWNEMGRIIDTIPVSTMSNLNYLPYFWTLKAERWQYTEQEKRALLVYLQGIRALPDSMELKKDYLWFLLNTNNKILLPNALARIQHLIPSSPDLWGASAVAYYRLQQPIETRNIVSLYSQQLQNNLEDPYWQLDLADIYDQTDPNMGMDFVHFGDELRRYTWPIYLNLLHRQGKPIYYDQLLNYLKLSQQEAAGDPTAIVIAQLMSKSMTPEAEELIVAWAIDQNNYDFAQAVYSNYLRIGLKPSATAILSLALYQEDRPMMRKLLIEKPEKLQYRDRVQAADRINALPLAQSLAMQGLTEHPNDYQMYDLFTSVMLESSHHVDLRGEFYQYGMLQGLRTYLAGTYFVTPGISLTPYIQDWFVHVNNSSQMATTPTPDEMIGLQAKFKTMRGFIFLDAAHRKSLESFPTILFAYEYLITHELNSRLELGYKQLANDTAFLYVGGYTNYLSLLFNYTITSRDLVTLQLAQKFFYTQDNHYLASGNVEDLAYEHYFWQQYPDLSLRFYVRGNQYYPKTNQLRGSILKLIPPDDGEANTDVNLVVPGTSTEYGITAQVGVAYLEDYTHSWKPFASATLLSNSQTGIGRIMNVGIAGTVIGRDHLAFYYENGTNQAPGVQKEILIGLSYRYYF